MRASWRVSTEDCPATCGVLCQACLHLAAAGAGAMPQTCCTGACSDPSWAGPEGYQQKASVPIAFDAAWCSDDVRITTTLLAALNAFLLDNGLDVAGKALELHQRLQPLLIRFWRQPRDFKLRDTWLLYLEIQLRLGTLQVQQRLASCGMQASCPGWSSMVNEQQLLVAQCELRCCRRLCMHRANTEVLRVSQQGNSVHMRCAGASVQRCHMMLP